MSTPCFPPDFSNSAFRLAMFVNDIFSQTEPSFQFGNDLLGDGQDVSITFVSDCSKGRRTNATNEATSKIGMAHKISAIRQSPPAIGSTKGKVNPAPDSSPNIIPFKYTVLPVPREWESRSVLQRGVQSGKSQHPIPSVLKQ